MNCENILRNLAEYEINLNKRLNIKNEAQALNRSPIEHYLIVYYDLLMSFIQDKAIEKLVDQIKSNTCNILYLLNNIHPFYLLDLIYATNKAQILPDIFIRIEQKDSYFIIKNLNNETRELLLVHLDLYKELEEIIQSYANVILSTLSYYNL